jgi:hypothetical protein
MENKTKYYNTDPIYGYFFNLNNWAHLRVKEGRSYNRILLTHIAGQPQKVLGK